MIPALALIAACSAGTPTGVDTGSNPADAPISVSPRALILEANQMSVFKAYASGVPGDSLVTSIEWTASGGSIGLDGTYSSPSTGDYKIVGKRHGPNRTTSDTAKVVVVPPQPTVAQVIVSPSSATVVGKTQQTFVATGKLSDNSTVPIGVTWTATGGSIDAGGVFTAGSSAGSYRIIAKAASANVADTVSVTVTAPQVAPPPASGGPQYPNMPGGMTQLFQYDGRGAVTSCPKTATSMTLGVACGQTVNSGRINFPSPGDAPFGGSVLDITYPTGLKGGNEPYDLWTWNAPGNAQMDEYYEAGWFRIGDSPNATSFEGPGTGEWKILGYWAVNNTPGAYSAQIYGIASGSSGVGSSWNLSIRAQGATSWTIGAGSVAAGKWYRYEIHMILNAPDISNGTLEVWLTNVSDGGAPVKVTSSTNRLFRTSSSPAGFWQRSFVPVWGGGGGVKTRDDHLQIARVAGFGSPM